MKAYTLRIFNKTGVCLFNHAWPGTAQRASLDDDARKMLYGSLFSLKQFIVKLHPVKEMPTTKPGALCYSFRTNAYELHVRETASGLVFAFAAEPSVGSLSETMRSFQDAWTDATARNPVAGDAGNVLSETTCVSLTSRVEALVERVGEET